jgi:hypothetical protein
LALRANGFRRTVRLGGGTSREPAAAATRCSCGTTLKAARNDPLIDVGGSLDTSPGVEANSKDIPMIKDAVGPGVHFQPLRLDIETGEWIVPATFAPGASVPLHHRTGVEQGLGEINYVGGGEAAMTAKDG